MRRGDLDELRLANPVPETPAPPPVERLLARLDQEPILDSRRLEPARRSRWHRVRVGGPLLVSVGVTVAIVVGAFVLLRGAGNPRPAPVNRTSGTTIQHLVDILGVLRRPQTPADRALPDPSAGRPGEAFSAAINEARSGTPVLRLARLATVAPWGQKIFIDPVTPLTATRAATLEHRYPQLRKAFQQLRQNEPHTVTLALYGGRETSFGSVTDIEQGHQTTVQGPNGILGLDGFAPPLRVVMVIPDGVAKISFVLPRQAYPGAIVYPAAQTITVPVHNNIAAFQTDRYIDEDHWSKIGMIWYASSGASVKRIGEFSKLNTVLPDPELSANVRTKPQSSWDSVAVIPKTGSRSTTFTLAFRRPVSGAHRYTLRFTGPPTRPGCTSPVSQPPITRGPHLGVPSTARGQIADTQLSTKSWCPGTYHVSVTFAGNAQPFSTTTFSILR
jgi:hypothetical protein